MRTFSHPCRSELHGIEDKTHTHTHTHTCIHKRAHCSVYVDVSDRFVRIQTQHCQHIWPIIMSDNKATCVHEEIA